MNISDPVADMLTRIRNALMAKHAQVEMPSSKLKVGLARILKEEGYIKEYEVTKDSPQPILRVALKYTPERAPVLTKLKRVSKPGLRLYTKRQNIPLVLGGLGTVILSTPQGLMTGKEAYRRRMGGEVICELW